MLPPSASAEAESSKGVIANRARDGLRWVGPIVGTMPHPRNPLLPLLLLVLSPGCLLRELAPGSQNLPRPSEAVPRGPRAQTFTQYGRWTEAPVASLSPEVLLDEAVLSISPSEFCFDVTVRAPRNLDLPLGLYEYECSVDGPDSEGLVTREDSQRTVEHPFVGEAPTVSLFGPHGNVTFPVGGPQDRVFFVVERRGQICCPAVPTQSLELTLSGTLPTQPRWTSSAQAEWRWTLVRRANREPAAVRAP